VDLDPEAIEFLAGAGKALPAQFLSYKSAIALWNYPVGHRRASKPIIKLDALIQNGRGIAVRAPRHN
jgi:hypothetical protein